MNKTIHVGLVTNADGAHLEQWYPALAQIDEIDGVAVVDPSGMTIDLARKLLGKKLRETYKDPADLYQRFRPSMAIAALESRLCPAAINQALDADCHVLSEKPGCVRAEDFAPLVKKAQMKHRHLMLVMANRTHAPVQEARRLIQKGLLGRLYGVEIHIVADQARLSRDDFRRTWMCSKARAGGGHLAWFGIMWLDLALYLTGLKIEAVSGFTANVGAQPLDVEDAAVLSLKFNDRCLGTLTSGYYLDKGVHSHIQIWGDKGWLKVSTVEEKPMEWYTTVEMKDPQIQTFNYPRGGRGFVDFFRQAAKSCLGPDAPPMTGDECLTLLRTMYAFYQAAQTERVVKIG